MAKNYNKLLKDPRWQRCRLLTLQRDNFTCVLCSDCRTTLHVHHEEYKGNPWDIAPEKLKTVCEHCHTIIHALKTRQIAAIHKQISLNSKCWEIVAFCEYDIVFLYMFFAKDQYENVRYEIITITPNYKTAA